MADLLGQAWTQGYVQTQELICFALSQLHWYWNPRPPVCLYTIPVQSPLSRLSLDKPSWATVRRGYGGDGGLGVLLLDSHWLSSLGTPNLSRRKQKQAPGQAQQAGADSSAPGSSGCLQQLGSDVLLLLDAVHGNRQLRAHGTVRAGRIQQFLLHTHGDDWREECVWIPEDGAEVSSLPAK